MTKAEKNAFLGKIEEHAKSVGYYTVKEMTSENRTAQDILAALQDTAHAVGISDDDVSPVIASGWRKGARKAETEIEAEKHKPEQYVSFRIYECPEKPTETGKYIGGTPIFEQAFRAVRLAAEHGKSYFVKGVKPDGTEIPYTGGTHEN